MEKQTVVIEYYVNTQYWLDAYYAKYGVLDHEFAQKLNDSTPDNMRHFTMSFNNEKLVIFNKDKNEINTFYYQDLYCINKTENGYLFFINNQDFYFVSQQSFKSDELEIIHDFLCDYLGKNLENQIAEINNYKMDINRIYYCFYYLLFKKSIMTPIYILVMFLPCYFLIKDSSHALFFVCITIIYSIAIYFSIKPGLKFSAENWCKTSNKIFICSKVIFYEDRFTMTAKTQLSTTVIKYDQLHKIRKVKKGYLFIINCNSGYLFYNEDFTPQQRQVLEDKLLQYNNFYLK